MEGRAAFVVLAGGSGTRLGAGVNKVYLPLLGRPLISWSLAWAARVPAIGPVLLVIRPGDEEAAAAAAVAAAGVPVETTYGGSTRHRSEEAALAVLRSRIEAGALDVVVIHDGARPLAGPDLLARVVTAAAEHGGAVPTVPEPAAWELDGDRLRAPAHPLQRVQTPQAFRARALLAAYDGAATEGTDTAAAFEGVDDVTVVAVPGSADNLKVTYPADLARAERLLRERDDVEGPGQPGQ